MEKVLQKYGIGIFVRPPVLPEVLKMKFNVQAPEGVVVSCSEFEIIVDVPDNFVSEEVIRLTGSGRGHLTLTIGAKSEVRIEEAMVGPHDVSLGLMISEGACVKYLGIQEDDSGFVTRTANVSRNASLHWKDIILGGDFARSSTLTKLAGENAETETDAIFFGMGEQEFDLLHEVVHLASHTRSEMRTRGILGEKAKTVARGLVRVEEGSRHCSGRQRIDTLLLSNDAEIDAVPHLEIANDEVACAHGATISRIDDAKLFYMMSRGMDRNTAKRAYIEAFLGIEDEALLERVMRKAV